MLIQVGRSSSHCQRDGEEAKGIAGIEPRGPQPSTRQATFWKSLGGGCRGEGLKLLSASMLSLINSHKCGTTILAYAQRDLAGGKKNPLKLLHAQNSNEPPSRYMLFPGRLPVNREVQVHN